MGDNVSACVGSIPTQVLRFFQKSWDLYTSGIIIQFMKGRN